MKRILLTDLPDERRAQLVFDDCNVCGIDLKYKHEAEMGMCERCANEELEDDE